LTSIENHILCTILSINANGKFPTTLKIAELLGLSERTVRDKVKGLRKNGLIDPNGLCVTISDDSYWLDAQPTAKKPTLINEGVSEQFIVPFPAKHQTLCHADKFEVGLLKLLTVKGHQSPKQPH